MTNTERHDQYKKYTDLTEAQRQDIRLKDWEQFVKHAKTAAKYSKEQNNILKTNKIESEPAQAQKIKQFNTLSEYTDFYFFHLGVVYERCAVPFDLINEFINQSKYDGPRIVLDFQHEFIEGLNDWGNLLEGIANDTQVINQFQRFILAQEFIRNKNEIWAIKHYKAIIADPLAVDNNTYKPLDTSSHSKAVINLFLPTGNITEIQPDHSTELPLRLKSTKPTAAMRQRAKVINSVTLPGRLNF